MQTVTDPEELSPAIQGKSAMVLFHSSWCPFCRRFKPVFDSVAADQGAWEPLEVLLEEDENPLWNRFEIEVVPTVLFFREGQVVKRLDGRPGVGLREPELRAALR